MRKSRPAPSPPAALVSQEQLLPFLLNPRSYPHRPRTVRLVQTHASFVFLAPPLVYKVKKPVNFGFLNFSTLEQRRHFCEREVVLNRRLSPDIYLGVVPISRREGRFVFGDGDAVVEYAVQMRKLADGGFLDQLIARQRVGPADLNRIAAVLKDFYEAQHPTAEIEAWGRIDRLRILALASAALGARLSRRPAAAGGPAGRSEELESARQCPRAAAGAPHPAALRSRIGTREREGPRPVISGWGQLVPTTKPVATGRRHPGSACACRGCPLMPPLPAPLTRSGRVRPGRPRNVHPWLTTP